MTYKVELKRNGKQVCRFTDITLDRNNRIYYDGRPIFHGGKLIDAGLWSETWKHIKNRDTEALCKNGLYEYILHLGLNEGNITVEVIH